jgi:hypothetical protein
MCDMCDMCDMSDMGVMQIEMHRRAHVSLQEMAGKRYRPKLDPTMLLCMKHLPWTDDLQWQA